MPESKSGAFTNLATPLEDVNSNTFFWTEIQNSENLVQNVLQSFRRQRGIQLATNRLLPRRREAANEDKGGPGNLRRAQIRHAQPASHHMDFLQRLLPPQSHDAFGPQQRHRQGAQCCLLYTSPSPRD